MGEHIEFVGLIVVGLVMLITKLIVSRWLKLEGRVSDIEKVNAEEFKEMRTEVLELLRQTQKIHLEIRGEYVRRGECQYFRDFKGAHKQVRPGEGEDAGVSEDPHTD
jgi:hypothetical protein